MRITERSRYLEPSRRIERHRERSAKLQEQILSGHRIHKPSDDPLGALRVRALESQRSRWVQHGRAQDRATATLGLSDAKLGEANEALYRAKELAIQGINASLLPEDAEIISGEILALREHLRALANSRSGEQWIFGGGSGDPPYADDFSYQGDLRAPRLEVGERLHLESSLPGGLAFGDGTADTRNLFEDLKSLAEAISDRDNGEMQTGLENLELGIEQQIKARARVGTQLQSLEAARAVHETLSERLPEELSDLRDADLSRIISELSLSENALQATMALSGRIMAEVSLLNYLR